MAIGLLLILVLLGAWIVADFGMSWDEHRNADVGRNALAALRSEHAYQAYLEHGISLAHHGPGFLMLQAFLAGVIGRVVPVWHAADARHFVTYLSYLLALVAFYRLSVRLIPLKFGLMATGLFALQPLVFGHAFINQKDTPFMAFFLAALAFGLEAGDRLLRAVPVRPAESRATTVPAWSALRQDWAACGRWPRVALIGYLVLLALALADILYFERGLTLARSFVAQMYTGQAWPPAQALFNAVAQDAHKSPLEAYWFKIDWAYLLGRMMLLVVLALLGGVLGLRFLPRGLGGPAAAYRSAYPLLLLAAVCLGMTIAIRPVGAFAAVLVGLDWIVRLRRRMPVFLLLYLGAAGVISYFAWPWIWQAPLQNLLLSLSVNLDFEEHLVIYRGIHYMSEDLPWDYFPTLAALQLTEPVLPLFLLGLIISARSFLRRQAEALTLAVMLLWLGLPTAVILAGRTAPYGTIRQMLFVLPPVFLICGVGLHWLLSRAARWRLDWVIYVLILAPGVVGIVRLHPYEYTYFNSVIGGTSGAADRFETDYWCTSYREAMDFINAEAEPEAVVAVFGPVEAAGAFARNDLKIRTLNRARGREAYWLVCAGKLETADASRPDLVRVHTLGIGDSEFAVVFGRPAGP